MIDWAHEDCISWGEYMRKKPKAWPSKSFNWRLWREGGAKSGSFGPSNPMWDMEKNVLDIHVAYLQMPEILRSVMDVCYRKKWAPDKKADALGMSRAQMYQYRSRCHYFILGQLAKKDSRFS
jgi:hypothetical protein